MTYKQAYAILQLNNSTTITLRDVKKQYRLLVQKNHPDNGGNTDTFMHIQEAYKYILEKGIQTICLCKYTHKSLFDIQLRQ